MTIKLKHKSGDSDEPEKEEVVAEVEPTTEAPVEEHEEHSETEISEAEKIRAENAALKARMAELEANQGTKPQPQPRITSQQLAAMSDKEREFVEAQTGMEFDKVLRNIQAEEEKNRHAADLAIRAKLAYREALEDAIDNDPQVKKLTKHIKAYFENIPDADKLDSKKMSRHMDIAVTYGKGKTGTTISRDRQKLPPKVETSEEDEVSEDIKPGVYDKGGFRINIENLISEETRKKIKHPEHKFGIRIPSDFDEAPKFRR